MIDKREVWTLQFQGGEGTVNVDVVNIKEAWHQGSEYGPLHCLMLGSKVKKANTLQELRLRHNELLKETRKEVLEIALVLERVKDNPPVHERIGVVRLSRKSNWFQNAPLVAVSII
jgi:hypothetical protein